MNTPEKFSDALLEQDIERLQQAVRQYAELPENKNVAGREIVREALQSTTQESAPPEASAEDSILPSYAHTAPDAVKLDIERLLDVVIHKGIEVAVKEARRASPFILDALHDALVDKLYPEFKEQGIVS